MECFNRDNRSASGQQRESARLEANVGPKCLHLNTCSATSIESPTQTTNVEDTFPQFHDKRNSSCLQCDASSGASCRRVSRLVTVKIATGKCSEVGASSRHRKNLVIQGAAHKSEMPAVNGYDRRMPQDRFLR
ncbi:hypothetical protein TGRH88_068920 [Toxoplasma gondii]|uniref:Uncharacterized protein n=1 Tax=Toxoplasma gondii TaxID=5811 RepID=A0A7J6K0Z0_TOXGO|nr:hypothetical protein TGRH88_068920 [Toxoplasma gondii]